MNYSKFISDPWTNIGRSFRDENNEITKTMKNLSIIQHQTELEEKADNEEQWTKKVVDDSPG